MADISKEIELHHIFSKKIAIFGLSIDQMDLSGISDVFAEDVVGIYNGVQGHTSRDQFINSVIDNLGPGSNCAEKQHNITNLVINYFDENTAVTRCNFYAVHRGANRFAGKLWSTWGEYKDTWNMIDGDWKIVRRDYTTYFNDGPDEINSRG